MGGGYSRHGDIHFNINGAQNPQAIAEEVQKVLNRSVGRSISDGHVLT